MNVQHDILQASAKANSRVTSPYKPDKEQYGEPFGTESAMPGNYFKNDRLTEIVKEQAKTETARIARVGRAIAEIAQEQVAKNKSIEIDMMNDTLWHGTHEFVWLRWGKGGFGEGLVIDKKIDGGEENRQRALEKVAERGYTSLKQADTNGGIDIVGKDGFFHQVKVKDSGHKPKYKDSKDYDKLWWVNNKTWNIEEITG